MQIHNASPGADEFIVDMSDSWFIVNICHLPHTSVAAISW